MSKSRLYVAGDPERLVETVLSEVREALKKRLDEAYSAARSLLEDVYRESLAEIEKAIRNEASDLKERLKALEASNEVEIRMLESKVKAEYTDRVLREALRRISREVAREAYRRFLSKQLKTALEAMRKYTSSAHVISCSEDRELLEEIAEEVSVEGISYTVSENSLENCSGFILESSDKMVRLDYRLETVLQPVMDELRAIALRNLFPSQTP